MRENQTPAQRRATESSVKLSFTAGDADDGCPLREFLRRNGLSHSILVELARKQGSHRPVNVNGEPQFMNYRLTAQDEITLVWRESDASDNIAPVEMPIEIIYEDEFVMAVNKPAGLPVHPSRAHVYDTLANGVMSMYRDRPFMFRAINRLDKDTSGVVVLAKNALAACWCAEKDRVHMEKEYVGVVSGRFPESLTEIDAPIAREDDGSMRRVVREDGERAVTQAELIHASEGASVVRFWLKTGRTHQIRVHAAHAGHPLLGDPLYASDGGDGQALHAVRLAMTLPYSQTRKTFCAPFSPRMTALIMEQGISCEDLLRENPRQVKNSVTIQPTAVTAAPAPA